jgi:preprotein translocase subunit SecB
MSDGGVKAGFDFVSYKIDKIELKLKPKINFLLNNNSVKPENMKLGFKFRDSEKFDIDGKIYYIGGILISVAITDEQSNEEILSGEFSISGVFTPSGTMEQSVVENFAKVNIPALLMPYLRAIMSNVLANAGFGTVLLPLINIYEMAKNTSTKLVDHTVPPKE